MSPSTLPQQTAVRIALITLLACYGVMWPLAVIGISRSMALPIDERWAGSTMLILEGGIGVLWVVYTAGWPIALRVAAVTVALAYLIEFVGVRSGVLFGHYTYTGLLVPRLPGDVPLPIICAWLLSALGAVAISRSIVRTAPSGIIVGISALLSALLDACIEPIAAFIKQYWLWQDHGVYYGIPARNFVGWFLAGLAINAVVLRVVWGQSPARERPSTWVPIALFEATVAMFAIISLFRGYPVATLIGAVVIAGTLAPIIRGARSVDWHQGRSAAPSIRRSRASATASSSRE